MVVVLSNVVPRSRKHYLPSFSTDEPASENIMGSEKRREDWQYVKGIEGIERDCPETVHSEEAAKSCEAESVGHMQ